MWCTTRISRTWFIISGLKDLASLFATDFLDICPLRSKNLTVVMCLREDNNFRLLACCLQFFYGIQSFRPVGSQILDLPQQLPPEYRFIAPVIWFGYSIFLRLPKFSELSSSKLSLVHHLRSQGPGFTFRNRFSGYLSTAIKESYCGYVPPRGQQLPVARLLFAILLRYSIISPCRVANSGFAATTVS